MSRAPHLVGVRQAPKAGDLSLADSAMADGLVDAMHHVPMGATAEHLATTLRIPRARQDEFALRSHHRAVDALERLQSEIVAVRTSSGEVSCDEQPRADTSLAALGKLKPAFVADGTVTAGNAASLNDGSAAVVLAAESEVVALGLTSLGRIVCCATSALAPMDMGLGAATAASAALIKSGWSVEDVDLIEINEAFAVQTLAVIDRLDCDPDRVNVNGGAIALGHPIGASGARVLVTLLYEMTRRGAKRGLATLCIGGGQGIAICIEAS
jgi:acetyl-CoA C-acetyltransferase